MLVDLVVLYSSCSSCIVCGYSTSCSRKSSRSRSSKCCNVDVLVLNVVVVTVLVLNIVFVAVLVLNVVVVEVVVLNTVLVEVLYSVLVFVDVL